MMYIVIIGRGWSPARKEEKKLRHLDATPEQMSLVKALLQQMSPAQLASVLPKKAIVKGLPRRMKNGRGKTVSFVMSIAPSGGEVVNGYQLCMGEDQWGDQYQRLNLPLIGEPPSEERSIAFMIAMQELIKKMQEHAPVGRNVYGS